MISLQKMISLGWVERENALGHKGKTADKLALEYVVGAHVAAKRNGGGCGGLILLVSVRGALELRRIASEATDAEREEYKTLTNASE